MTVRKLTDEQLEKLVNHLRGSTTSLTTATEELFDLEENDLTIEDCQLIDTRVFNCEVCGWWCDIEEEASEDESRLICTDCADNND